ncbi:MAG TPA: hypothetical protein PK402_06225, partial [Tepidisphaeraceae bacterium]|nr:hypothetical protein [Tepidisphaeraceae bacterium]
MIRLALIFVITLSIHACAFAARPALTADDLALVVNIRQPEGKLLAEHYAQVRKVPEGRIIEIDIEDKFSCT